ncbi:hypothetical protein CCACVL1_04209, partial [Corchorus capsularis]
MASLNVYVALAVLFIVASGTVMAREVDVIKANNCEDKRKMSLHCVNEVFTSVFKTGNVCDDCCHELAKLGDVCHQALVERTLNNPIYKKNDTS